MFGMSRDERRRLEAAERTATEGKDAGVKATAELAAHTAVCTERHGTITKRLDGIDKTLAGVNKQGWVIILGVLGAILLEIAKARGLF
jgi:hypothetical protein